MKPELLAPAGNYESLIAAIAAGCDAVYLAGKHYGARNYAGNFSDDELIEAIKYAHLYGVKVYVTINTLIYDAEVPGFIKYVSFLHKNNVDAVIIQDIGMMSLIRQKFPNLEVHASTQMHIHNLEGLKLLKDIGVKRAVVARETNVSLIKEMVKEDIEIEVFIHGALCMSYSGQCLMSSLIGGRSGNRGTCAQSCRQPYSLMHDGKVVAQNKYLLSTKDLNTSKYIYELLDIGVKSFKIEGRMKRPEYVYQVVSFYRTIIDNYLNKKKNIINNEDIKNLKKLFNREFTKGFIFNEENDNYVNELRPNHLGIEIGKVVKTFNDKIQIKLTDDVNIGDGIRILDDEDIGFNITNMFINNEKVNEAHSGDIITIKTNEKIKNGSIVLKTSDIKQLALINKKIKENARRVSLSGKLSFKDNKLVFNITDGINEVTKVSKEIEESKTSPATLEMVLKQLTKLGNTVYKMADLKIDIPNNLFIPVSVLNDLRRDAVEEISLKRLYEIPYIEKDYHLDVLDYPKTREKAILISSLEDFKNLKEDYDIVYVDNYLEYLKIDSSKKVLKLPRVLESIPNYSEDLLVGELGSLYKYKNVTADYSLNVTNAYTVAFLHFLGANKVTLSYEMNDNQIKKLIENYHNIFKAHPNLELILEANEEVMIMKYDILKKYKLDNYNNYLIDRFNNKYKIINQDGFTTIYNYKRRKMNSNYYDMGINSIRVNLEK